MADAFGSGGVRVARPPMGDFDREVSDGGNTEDSFENLQSPDAGPPLDEQKLLGEIVSASNAEQAAIESDRAKEYVRAAEQYDESVALFRAAEDAARALGHRDADALARHREDIQRRAEYLRTDAPTWPGGDVVPVEQHIQSIQLTIGAKPPLVTPVSGAVIFGAAAGLLTLGPLGAVVSAAAFAYAATRTGPVGSGARKVGKVTTDAVAVAAKVGEDHAPRTQERLVQALGATVEGCKLATRGAQDFAERHQVAARVTAASSKLCEATSTGVAKARDFNTKHRVTERVAGGVAAAAANVRNTAISFDEKHHVADKVSGWLRQARDKAQGAIGR